ncbi:phosphatase PAP2 family protein [Mucilaginibacter terrae]|uniref:Membrane-associated phospholipid phosphatase n=1 Tax=Mucilaginibacter terrae TaxID=1955052 RepID=A0ABU3GTW0_9SPHI|nr:phosphatase PAP2 family protein [Mucilaginibacter terrae]MDT3403214.1 membrane-associated phospholipid phosphatase [Mucilaginibacter terrae]
MLNNILPLYKYVIAMFTVLCVTNSSLAQITLDTARKDSTDHILQVPDTVKHLESKFISFIPPAAFIGYGFLSLGVKPIRDIDYHVYNDVQKDHPNFHTPIDDYFQYVPVITVYGLNAFGLAGKNRFIDRTILLAMSQAIRLGTVTLVKKTADRLRPNGFDRQSFPSGHASTAFATAEFMAQEYGEVSPWFGVYAYSFATATAILRVYNNDHWFSDIIAGAGFGILSTKAAYLLYPYIRNTFFRNDKNKDNKKAALFIPTYNNGYAGFTFVKTF